MMPYGRLQAFLGSAENVVWRCALASVRPCRVGVEPLAPRPPFALSWRYGWRADAFPVSMVREVMSTPAVEAQVAPPKVMRPQLTLSASCPTRFCGGVVTAPPAVAAADV